ncbi:hypothetical protein HDU84_006194 [Entophlyctis sp. JEL0112]|nr:hypothetical protein HDU84_006194 [Entophlyctis sp. JEL0112]
MGINEFMKRRAEIEAEYGHALQKLSKACRDDMARKLAKGSVGCKAVYESSLGKAWQQVLEEADAVATIHFGLSDKVNTELRKTIKYQSQDNEKKFKEHPKGKRGSAQPGVSNGEGQSVAKSSWPALTSNNVLRQLREKFESDRRAMETAKANQAKVMSSKNATQKEIDAVTDEIQTDDENFRIRATKVALMKYYELFSSMIPMYIENLEAMFTKFEQVSADADTALAVGAIQLHDEYPPADYVFEEKAVQDANYKRIGGQAQKGGHSRSPTDAVAEPDEDEQILSQPPKKGRALAAARVKSLDKEISDAAKRLVNVDALIAANAQRAAPDATQSSELKYQKHVLEVRLDNMGLSKHKLQCYIAAIDKAPMPELPPTLSGKSPTQPTMNPVSYAGAVSPASLAPSSPAVAGLPASPTKEAKGAAPVGSPPNRSLDFGINNNWKGSAGNVSSKDVKKARMIYDFQAASGTGEVSAKTGDAVEVLEEQDDGWWSARVFSGGEWREGLIPG